MSACIVFMSKQMENLILNSNYIYWENIAQYFQRRQLESIILMDWCSSSWGILAKTYLQVKLFSLQLRDAIYVTHLRWSFLTDHPVETGRKLNVHKTFRRRPGRLLNVLFTLNLHPVSTGQDGRKLFPPSSFLKSTTMKRIWLEK